MTEPGRAKPPGLRPPTAWADPAPPGEPHNPRCLDESAVAGYSEQGLPLRVGFARTGPGDRPCRARILIVGGQHGDEPLARRAVAGFARALRHGRWPVPAGLELAFLAEANPDGASLDQRQNARGVDPNRDHQRLEAAETRALHRFVRAWRPGLVIDVHTYPPRRRHLSRRGKAYCHDVFVAGPTHPACLQGAAGEASRQLHESVIEGLRRAGYRSQHYTLIRPRTSSDLMVRNSCKA